MKLPFEFNKARKLSNSDIEEAIDLWLKGHSEKSIAERYGVARTTIRHHRLRLLDPLKFKKEEADKIKRNKRYKPYVKNTKDYLDRLRKAYGKDAVAKERTAIDKKTRNKEKRLKWQRAYRQKNRKRINANWMKNYQKKKQTL